MGTTRDVPRQPALGPHNPVETTPLPARGSMRRTWNADIAFPDGAGDLVVTNVRGRDLRMDITGAAETLDELDVVMEIDPGTHSIVAVHAGRAGSLGVLHGVGLRGG